MDFEEMKYWVKYDLFRIDKVETYRYHFKNRSGSVFKQKNAGKVYLLTPYTEYELIKEVKEIEDRLKVTCYLHFHSSIVLIIASLLQVMICVDNKIYFKKNCTWF